MLFYIRFKTPTHSANEVQSALREWNFRLWKVMDAHGSMKITQKTKRSACESCPIPCKLRFEVFYLTDTTASTTNVPKGITTILTSYLLFGESLGAGVPSV